MTPDEWLLDETRQWVLRASNDLRAAEICVSELPAEALYHCQQAAEKLLKGFLAWSQKPIRKTHELGELATACAEIDATLGPALEPAIALSQYAWRFRYPVARPKSRTQTKRDAVWLSPGSYAQRWERDFRRRRWVRQVNRTNGNHKQRTSR